MVTRWSQGLNFQMGQFSEQEKQRRVSSSPRAGDLFQDSLIVSGAKSRPRNPWAAGGALTIELLLILAAILIPLFHSDTLPKRRETVTALYLPPTAAASHVTRLPVPTSSFRSMPTKITIPSTAHTRQEAVGPPPVPVGGLVGGVPGGVVGGIPDGELTDLLRNSGGAPVLAPTPAPTPKRISVPAKIAEANLVYDVAPKYPPEAGRARIEGTVVLLAVIGRDGAVEDVRVKSGLPVLAQAAVEAVKQWRYRPYLLNGEPIEVDSQITINFALSKG
jgi:protein TonB